MRLVSLGLVLAAFWLLHSGHYTPLLLGLGVLSVLLTLFLARRMGIVDEEGHPVEFIVGALTYFPWLFLEIVKSSIGVARMALSPRLPIAPRMVEVDASQKSRTGVNVYANSITLTPGTITVAAEGNTLLVHALTSEGADDLLTGVMDKRVSRMERGSL